MPATEALLRIYGEIDRAVQLDPLARLRVSQLLPEYKDPGVRWYDDFLDWRAEAPGVHEDFPRWLAESREDPGPEGTEMPRPFRNVSEALAEFSEEDPADARIRSRLMFAIAVAARAFPQIKEHDSRLHEGAVGALSRLAPGGDIAKELLELLSDDRPQGDAFGIGLIPGTSAWWKEGVLTFLESRRISTIGMEAKPCTAQLVTVPGIDGPAAALRTEFDTEALAFKRATNFMEPENWKTCRKDFWCLMQEETDPNLPRGQRRYHEIVSSNCDKPRALFRAETRLLFNFMWIPTEDEAQAAVANYELAERPSRPNDLIQVDEGSLVVSRLGWRPAPDGASQPDGGSNPNRKEKLRITTTKRIKFNYPFSSQAIALMACALGWLDTGAQLVACAAAQGSRLRGTPFQGESTADAMKPRSERAGGSSGGPPSSLGGLCQEGVDIWARALRDGATALERHSGSGAEESANRQPRSGS